MDGETANELQRKSSDTHHVDTSNKKVSSSILCNHY